MATFHQIKENSKEEEIISKSRFIALSFCVQTKQETDEILQEIKTKYKDSTHVCYAFKLTTGEEKCSDDGEPQGTAGIPILDVIKKCDITNVLIVVVRYFGGIKLGAGGLVRAYSSSASNVIEKSGKIAVVSCKKINFSLPISQNKSIRAIEKLAGIKSIKVEYFEDIQLTIFVQFQACEDTKSQICNIVSRDVEFLEDSKIYFVGE